ncbi:anthranilate synthase component I family protein [bacterium SCSIO 12741]|nr:anthranilate synthase component I family protein [bacterium SCSIO 12741]
MANRKAYRIPFSGPSLNLHALTGIDPVVYLNSNDSEKTSYLAFGSIKETLPGDGFDALKAFHASVEDWLFGYLSYDLKNRLESLHSCNPDRQGFQDLRFFQPEVVIQLGDGFLEAHYFPEHTEISKLQAILQNLLDPTTDIDGPLPKVQFNPTISREEYIEAIQELKREIQYGNIYEANFCQEFHTTTELKDPISLYHRLSDISPTPYSAYMHFHEHHLICASPERFIQKKGNRILSQPIKGTIGRSSSEEKDRQLKKELLSSAKDRNENVMIVDLVRNDLARTCISGTVKVEELFGIYSFPQVHQMISTISGELKPNTHGLDALIQSYPMGSMTGAPKVKAMEIIEELEHFKRGLYSGSVGYLKPNGDYDFNVVIRSLFYQSETHALSFAVGGAITMKSDPQNEYEETLLKAKAIFELFQTDILDLQE